jgi:hypothetical protein
MEGLRRSPIIKQILNGHKTPIQQDRTTSQENQPQVKDISTNRPEGNVFTSFPGPVKFSSLTNL